MDVECDHARQRTEIRDRIWHWQYAMDQQADHATQAPLRLQHEFDGFFFVVALENLRASVAWGSSCCAEIGDTERQLQIRGVLDDFDTAVPHLESFLGCIREPNPRADQPTPAPRWSQTPEHHAIIAIDAFQVDVDQAAAAGHALAELPLKILQ